MDKRNPMLRLLADRPVAYHPDMARILGGVNEAVFLCQLLYWEGKGANPDWVWKTQEEWEQETALTRRNQETVREKLKTLGVLKEKLASVPARLHYQVDHDQLLALIEAYYAKVPVCTEEPCKPATRSTDSHGSCLQTIHETTAENTTDTPSQAVSSRPDFLDLAKRTFEKTKGKGSWTVTEEAGGADPWQDGPLTAFCELVKVEQPPPKLARGWARAIRGVAEEWGAVPAQAAQAIRLISDSEHKWHTFSSPHDKGFQSVLGIMIDRVITGGREDTAPTKVELW
jgi:hypothetical protein